MKPIVIIESPYAGDIERNVAYARACMRDSLLRGEAPYASHLLYTQPGVLRDEVPQDRELGITSGFAFRRLADVIAVYTDLGISSGMRRAIELETVTYEDGHTNTRRLQMRSLPDWAEKSA
mgnify:CR=1 FL=1|jgi:hypothetical protein